MEVEKCDERRKTISKIIDTAGRQSSDSLMIENKTTCSQKSNTRRQFFTHIETSQRTGGEDNSVILREFCFENFHKSFFAHRKWRQ